MHIDFLKQVISTTHDYWCVAREDHASNCGRYERIKDQIIFLSIPKDIPRGVEPKEILLSDAEKLERSNMDCNIFLNEPYAPFQIVQTFRGVYRAFPVIEKQREFIIAAMQMEVDDLYEYEKLYNSFLNQQQ